MTYRYSACSWIETSRSLRVPAQERVASNSDCKNLMEEKTYSPPVKRKFTHTPQMAKIYIPPSNGRNLTPSL